MAYPEYRIVDFGSSQTGLSSVSYQLFSANGSSYGGAITSGIRELGGGAYGALITFPDNFVGYLQWNNGSGVLAFDDINNDIIVNYPSSTRPNNDIYRPNKQVP
jgi:hypothetical protein